VRAHRRGSAVAAACLGLLLVAGVVAYLVLGRSGAPGAPSRTSASGGMAPPAPQVSPSQRASLPPAPSPSAPGPTGPPQAHVPAGLQLRPGPYGFSYPAGWVLTPLAAKNAQVQAASALGPGGPGRIDYVVDTSPAIYNPDHTVNLAIVLLAVPAAVACNPLTSDQYLPDRGLAYTCAPDAGLQVSGLVLLLPYAQGFRLLQVQLPLGDDAIAQEILSGYH
jgi:hypothetical protein